MKSFFAYLFEKRFQFLLTLVFVLIFLASFWLFRIPPIAVWCPAGCCLVLGGVALGFAYGKHRQKQTKLQNMLHFLPNFEEDFPNPIGVDEETYQQMIRQLAEEQQNREEVFSRQYDDMIQYYTLWTHQIKTPIAAMQLKLQNEDTPAALSLKNDLRRIESYVNTVMAFVRLGSDETDYLFRETDLDELICQSLRKFSGDFIAKKLTLQYEPVHVQVLTDEKWLCFVLEQVLSNAVKYTKAGGTVSIRLEEPKKLWICDNGVGILPEDLPRIFDRGYTGHNGRTDKRASGIGLSLCKQICDRLHHRISVTSTVNQGTAVCLNLDSKFFGE